MYNGSWWKWLAALACGLALLFLRPGDNRAQGQTADPTLQELKARLERVEQQNRELMEKLQSVGLAGQSGPYRPPDPKEEQAKLETRIDAYLKERDSNKSAEPEAYAIGSVTGLKGDWRDYGYWLHNADDSFKFRVSGWMQGDVTAVDGPQRMFGALKDQGIGKFDDGVNFRRLRVRAEGTMWDQFDFMVEFDYSLAQRVAMPGNPVAGAPLAIQSQAGTVADRSNLIGVVTPTDVWMQVRDTPVGNIRVGNVKPMYSMENLQNTRFVDFMEFSYIWDAFTEQGTNGWIPSLLFWGNFGDLHGSKNRWFWGAALSWSNNRDFYFFNQGDGELEETARIGYTVWDENDGRNLLNLSVGSMHQAANDGQLRYRARFELRNGNELEQPTLAQVQGALHDAWMVQPELFFNCGSFNVQAEWAFMAVDQTAGAAFTAVGNQTAGLPRGTRGDLYWNGGYVSLSYFLTGEARSFDRTWKTPDRVVPFENVFSFRDGANHWNLGGGAWQVLARWNYFDMNSKGINGGVLNGLTLGVNWFLNPNARLMWNFVADHRDAVQYANGVPASPSNVQNGWLYGVGARFHIDF